MRKRQRIYKPSQAECHWCERLFVYFQTTKRRIYCTPICARKAGNDHFNALESAAREAARAA